MILKRKVYVYITHKNRLLIFRHTDFPEVGLQVPGGTIEHGEVPIEAAQREAYEETGLEHLRLNTFLGMYDHDFSEFGQTHRRHFYHLICEESPPEQWEHLELDPSDGSPAPIRFAFFWVELPDGVPPLIAGQDRMLPELMKVLKIE